MIQHMIEEVVAQEQSLIPMVASFLISLNTSSHLHDLQIRRDSLSQGFYLVFKSNKERFLHKITDNLLFLRFIPQATPEWEEIRRHHLLTLMHVG